MSKSKRSATVKSIVKEFLQYTERHHSQNTLRFYTQRLAWLTGKKNRRSRAFSSIKPKHIDKWLYKAGKGMSDSTKHHNANTFLMLQRFAKRNGLIRKRIVKHLDMPRVGQRERIPTVEEMQRILEHATPAFKLIYRALWRTGARPGEMCKLQIHEVLFAEGKCVLKEHKTAKKTGKPREIGIGPEMAEILKEAIGERTSGPVFLTVTGEQWSPAHLSTVHRKLRDRAELDPKIVLYSTRHRFATELCNRGENAMVVARLMGHSDVKTTQKYVHVNIKDVSCKQDSIA